MSSLEKRARKELLGWDAVSIEPLSLRLATENPFHNGFGELELCHIDVAFSVGGKKYCLELQGGQRFWPVRFGGRSVDEPVKVFTRQVYLDGLKEKYFAWKGRQDAESAPVLIHMGPTAEHVAQQLRILKTQLQVLDECRQQRTFVHNMVPAEYRPDPETAIQEFLEGKHGMI